MAKVVTDNKFYAAIADAIRSKTGSSKKYKPSEMAAAIKAIVTGVVKPLLQKITVAPTGTAYTRTPDSGYDGFSEVVVAGDSNLVEGNIKKGVSIYGKTGTYEGNSTEAKLQYLEVTPARAAHIYEPEEGYDGFSEVKVTGDGDLLPENIVSGVTIFGVIGTAKTGSGETAKTTAIDYSNYASGTFTETLDTGEDITYNVTLDSEGKPTQITSDGGVSVAVEW